MSDNSGENAKVAALQSLARSQRALALIRLSETYGGSGAAQTRESLTARARRVLTEATDAPSS